MKIDDGSTKPEGHETEDGCMRVEGGEYVETENGQLDRWRRHAGDLFDICHMLRVENAQLRRRIAGGLEGADQKRKTAIGWLVDQADAHRRAGRLPSVARCIEIIELLEDDLMTRGEPASPSGAGDGPIQT